MNSPVQVYKGEQCIACILNIIIDNNRHDSDASVQQLSDDDCNEEQPDMKLTWLLGKLSSNYRVVCCVAWVSLCWQQFCFFMNVNTVHRMLISFPAKTSLLS